MKVGYELHIWDDKSHDPEDESAFGEYHDFLTELLSHLRVKYPKRNWDGLIEEIIEPVETTVKSQVQNP